MMSRIDAVPLQDCWNVMSWIEKERLVVRLAELLSVLFANRFNTIGSLEIREADSTTLSSSIQIGPIASIAFWWHEASSSGVSRGPFASTYHWMQARLDLSLHSARQLLSSEDEDDKETGAELQEVLEQLAKLMPIYFPPYLEEQTTLFHHDLHRQNILVDQDRHTLIALVDWECTAVVPLWSATSLPKFPCRYTSLYLTIASQLHSNRSGRSSWSIPTAQQRS